MLLMPLYPVGGVGVPGWPVTFGLLHLTFCLVSHWLTENVVCVDVNYHHYVPVALLRGERECSCLVRVDGDG
jgi:hypothetical protein